MNDMRMTIIPKSDQLNADDLIGGPMTVKVSKVSINAEADQPVSIHFEGDNGKPYKLCKSMRRVLVSIWGPDANAYTGRSMTLYRDDKVVFGAVAVGGIRISHMSNIDKEVTMALTATRASRKPYTVKPLKVTETPRSPKATDAAAKPPAPVNEFPAPADDDLIQDVNVWADELEHRLDEAADRATAVAAFNAAAKETEWAALKIDDPARANAIKAKATRFEA